MPPPIQDMFHPPKKKDHPNCSAACLEMRVDVERQSVTLERGGWVITVENWSDFKERNRRRR